MFSFFKRSPKISTSLSVIGADMHNHLLPGIDDGSPDVETSLFLLERMMELGYKKFISTPHVILEVHPNNKETISNAWQQFTTGIAEKGLNVPVEYAAEYMLNFDFDNLLKEDKVLSFGNKNVLIEMSYAVESPNLKDAIFILQTKGFRPILAHPERYPYLFHNLNYYEDLIDCGCDLQINLLSLVGYYGKPIKNVAEKLIDRGLISWLGSDLHHDRHLAALTDLASNPKALKYIDKIVNLRNPSLLEY
jgi:protein-tyrosine phosphatase